MSSEASAWAMAQRPKTVSEKLLLAVVARWSDPAGVTFVGREKMAEEAMTTPAKISGRLGALEEQGLLIRIRRQDGQRRESNVIVLAPNGERGGMLDLYERAEWMAKTIPTVGQALRAWLDEKVPGGEPSGRETAANGQGAPMGTFPPGDPRPSSLSQASLDHVQEGLLSSPAEVAHAGAREGGPPSWKFRGKPVPLGVREVAWPLFHECLALIGGTSKPFRPSTGEASPDLKTITGAVLDHPEVTLDGWRAMMARMVERPWWTGPTHVGVLFSPNVVDRNLSDARRTAKVPTANKYDVAAGVA
jgi:hypothetical protein